MTRHNVLHRNLYILNNYVLRRRKIPFLASYKLTYRCNLTCEQCPFRCMEAEDPAFGDVLDTLERLYARGNRIVIFEGGEPMLWRDGEHTIHEVIKQAKKRFFCVGMTTNGTVPLDVPTDILWVSIDGFEETHNCLRGKDIFNKIIKNIKASPHPKIFAHLTVNSQNHMQIPGLIEFLSNLVKGVTIQFYYPYNRKDALFLDLQTRGRLLDEVINLKASGYPVMNSRSSLEAMKSNKWHCVDWLIDNANPDGSLSQGCYLKGRDDIDCEKCGFTPHAEASLAYQGSLGAIKAGIDIFFKHMN